MARSQAVFICGACGRQEPKWLGHCPDCGAWDSFNEGRRVAAGGAGVAGRARRPGGLYGAARPVSLSEVDAAVAERFSSGIAELDRVLGGGIVPGSLILVGGEPGIGKSTLLLQVLDHVTAERSTLLVCGEESAAQVKLRAERVCVDAGALDVLAETETEVVIEAIAAARPALVVIDSVQTMASADLAAAPGSVGQVRESASRLLRLAKSTGTAVILVGHVTKEGAIAGPRVLEHVVDAVLQFEGDRYRLLRTVRAVKNRFGSTDELGVFEMTDAGLRAVADPSALFLSGAPAVGAAVHIAVEGSRCFLVEVQALVNRSELAVPRRVTVGFDRNRLAMLLAVLDRHTGLLLSSADVFVTIAGGIRIDEPAADLAVALAVASAQRDQLVSAGAAVFGEISLTGGLRSCSQSERRITEARRAGLKRVVVPDIDARRAGGRVIGAATVRDAFAALLVGDTPRSAIVATDDEWGV